MAQLPRYQRLGVRTRQPGNIDFADTREQARYSQNLSGALDRMSQFAFKEASAAAQTRGQARVRDEGAVETLEAIDKKGGAFSIADQAAYELGSRVAVAEIQNTAEIETMRILGEAERNETPFSVVQAQLLDLTDGYSESLRVIDPTASSVLRENLNGVTAKATERYSNYYVKLQASKQAAKKANAFDREFGNIVSDAILPGKTVDSISQDIERASKLLTGLGATEDELKTFSEKSYNAAYKEKTIYEFNTASLADKENMLTTMETTPLPGMSLGETQSIRKSLRADYNAALSVSKGQANAVIADVSEQARILALGGTPSEKEIMRLSERANSLGDLGAGAKNAIEDLNFNVQLAETYRKMTPEDLFAEIEGLKEGTVGLGGPGVDTLREAETLQVANAYLNAANKSMKAASDAEKAKFQPDIDKLTSDISTFQDLLDSGIEVTESDLEAIFEDISAIPLELRAELPAEFRALKATSGISENMRDMTPKQAADYIASFRATDIDTQRELKALKFAESFLSNMETELKSDPLRYATNVGVKDAIGNTIQITNIDLANTDNTVSSIKKRIDDATVISSKYMIEPRYFTNQETSMLSEYLSTANRSQQMFLMGSIVDGGGRAAPDMLAEISKTSPEFAGIGALVADGNIYSANIALRGLESLKAGFKPIEFTPENTDLAFNKKTTRALRYMPSSTSIVRDVAKAIYADTAKFEEAFNEDLWIEAIDSAAGGKVYSDGTYYGGIQDVRGQSTLVPSKITADMFESALENITVESLFAATNSQIVNENLAREIARTPLVTDWKYKVVARGGNEFAILYGDPDKGNPIFVQDNSSDPVIFDIMKLIEAQK